MAVQSEQERTMALAKKRELAPGVYYAKVSDDEAVLFVSSDELPVPERSMFANWVQVRREGSNIEIGFGQLTFLSDTLSAALFVSISPENVARALYGGPNEFVDVLSSRVGESRLTDAREAKLPPHGERIVLHRASVMNIAYASREAEIRFYAVSPRAMHDLKSGNAKKVGKGVVSTVVKIDLSIEHLDLLCRELSQCVARDETPPDIHESERV